MNINLNLHLLSNENSYRNAGISRYIYNLVDNLFQIDNENRYNLYLKSKCKNIFSKQDNLNFKYSSIDTENPVKRIFWEQFIFPFSKNANINHYFHVSAPVLPKKGKSIVTIYDLSFMYFPDFFKKSKYLYLKNLSKYMCEKADYIMAISENTKKDIIKFFNIPEKKVFVIYGGLEESVNKIEDKNNIEKYNSKVKYDLTDKYILTLGTLQPRKNIMSLVYAYEKLLGDEKIDQNLVICGGKGWLYDDIIDYINQKDILKNRVFFTDYVSDMEKNIYLNFADFVVLPSFYEGFGFPLLEAMSVEKCCITSNVSSHPEIGKNSVLYFDPKSVDELYDKMKSVINNKDLKNMYSKLAFDTSKEFNWKNEAEKLLEKYKEIS